MRTSNELKYLLCYLSVKKDRKSICKIITKNKCKYVPSFIMNFCIDMTYILYVNLTLSMPKRGQLCFDLVKRILRIRHVHI